MRQTQAERILALLREVLFDEVERQGDSGMRQIECCLADRAPKLPPASANYCRSIGSRIANLADICLV